MATLTAEDIKLIIDAQKEAFYTKEEMDVEFNAMREWSKQIAFKLDQKPSVL